MESSIHEAGTLKAHFMIPQYNFLQKNWDFLNQQKPLQIHNSWLCAKYFLQIHLFGKIINRIVNFLCWHTYYQQVDYKTTLWYSKTCITQKQKLRIDWRNSILLNYIYHKNSMLGSQNWPLRIYLFLCLFAHKIVIQDVFSLVICLIQMSTRPNGMMSAQISSVNLKCTIMM